jgi:site-specific DNA recombinase
VLADHYDDGGISGGHLERPALQRLMQAVDDKRVDQIVVYKIDRLTRSSSDFAKLVDRLDAAEASFVSVTQSFNTATSMGRLTLNVLLSFAQFEREVTAERIRDKIAASKRKGLWMGGTAPIGYLPDGRTLKIEDNEVETIRVLYELYLEHGNVREVAERACALALRSRIRERAGGKISGGTPFERGHIHHILTNPIYAGRIRHKRKVYDGLHPAIIDPETWEQVQRRLVDGAARERGTSTRATSSPLIGKLFDETGDGLTPSHTRKSSKRLRYYISRRLVTNRSGKHPEAWRLPAEQIEALLADLICRHLKRAEMAANLLSDVSAAEILAITERLAKLDLRAGHLAMIERVDLKPGWISVLIDRTRFAKVAGCKADQINPGGLVIEAPFQRRRRGVELKLHLGDAPSQIDLKLVQNVVKAQRWLDMILNGKTFTEIAEIEGTSKRRIQDVIDLALLAPETLKAISEGTQPHELTSDYLIKTGFSAKWSAQQDQFAAL